MRGRPLIDTLYPELSEYGPVRQSAPKPVPPPSEAERIRRLAAKLIAGMV